MHVTVLAEEAIEWLRIAPDGVYVDGTTGFGGHTLRIAERLGDDGRVFGLDRDPQAVEMARKRVQAFPQATILHRNYDRLSEVVEELKLPQLDGVLIDAGVSSMQLDDPARGFTFQEEGPLDMRMDRTSEVSAETWLAEISENDLAAALKRYGDIRKAKTIAAAICRWRVTSGMTTTADLVAAVKDALPFVSGVPEETRTVFQAIRIAVNNELRSLERFMAQAIDSLETGGRLVCITFHSGEDRIVKNVLKEAGTASRRSVEDAARSAGERADF
ncbi:MAG TPA: 16S rRNA (cytosine(1402)-N(4))-methyltransferase RsmH [Candidatus Hydrogenedentes bacterium]|nr:16S rRNA (cytosine(1402)-N(4))-methyltransferase RsmH [Candidatus Hydrogenedentota bacterium]